ncbi:hypothetical protein RyT2_24010 [Pseudolactococcus yaeyamensis]
MDFNINNKHTNDKNDWRFTDQDLYLLDIDLYHRAFKIANRDHDHCQFCWKKFGFTAGDLLYGYCDKSKYYWICEECYSDFYPIFKWRTFE